MMKPSSKSKFIIFLPVSLQFEAHANGQERPYKLFFKIIGNNVGAIVRALAFHNCEKTNKSPVCQ